MSVLQQRMNGLSVIWLLIVEAGNMPLLFLFRLGILTSVAVFFPVLVSIGIIYKFYKSEIKEREE